MAQVKFYAKTSLPTENIDEGGVYFIQGGELYKGAQRFGLGRVAIVANEAGLSSIENPARGDIAATAGGAAWVYAGSEAGKGWTVIGGDTSSLQSLWRSDIKSWTSGLVAGGEGSYITGITQAADGKVTASAAAFPDLTFITGDSAGAVKLGSTNATVNGWADLVYDVEANTASISGLSTKVSTLETKVSGIEGIVDVANSKVTATTGSFTNLTVSDTATFSATTVSATTLTIGGSTVEQLADKQIASIAQVTQTSASNGITVGVTTKAGSVTAVSVDATAFGNVMKFRGVVSNTSEVTTPASGDIAVIGSEPDTGFKTGQEYIYDGSKWELIGDQNTYAVNAYSSTASVYTGVATVPGALNAAGSAIDTLTTNMPKIGSSTSSSAGIEVTMSIAATDNPIIGMTVDKAVLKTALSLKTAAYVDTANAVTAAGTDLPTQSAVYSFVTTLISGLDSTVTSTSGNVGVTVTQTDGKLTACTVTFDWIED